MEMEVGVRVQTPDPHARRCHVHARDAYKVTSRMVWRDTSQKEVDEFHLD